MLIQKRQQVNMIEGSLLGKMLRFAFPLICTNLLQLFYNSADMFVVGNFCDDPNALGSVGCTGSTVHLILGLMLGLSSGVSVVVSQSIGSGDNKRVERSVHTAILLAVFTGIIIGTAGFFITPMLLRLLDTPAEFIEGSTLYVKIFFLGTVFNALFNFCSGILRSRGDTLRPLVFSSIGGIVNVILNLFFVISFGMGVEGVAIATVISQFISAVLSLIYLTRLNDGCRLNIRKLAIDRGILTSLIRIGIPAGLQGMMFSISNMILQSSYNRLGPVYVNANTAAQNVDSYIYNVLTAFYHVGLTFASQNYGAKKYKRILKVYGLNCITITVIGLVLGIVSIIFAAPLISIFDSDPTVVETAKSRLIVMGASYFLCGIMDSGTAMLRSLGKSLLATIITVFGICILRVIWVYTIFANFEKLIVLYAVYPVTWIFTSAALGIAFFVCYKRIVGKEKIN